MCIRFEFEIERDMWKQFTVIFKKTTKLIGFLVLRSIRRRTSVDRRSGIQRNAIDCYQTKEQPQTTSEMTRFIAGNIPLGEYAIYFSSLELHLICQ